MSEKIDKTALRKPTERLTSELADNNASATDWPREPTERLTLEPTQEIGTTPDAKTGSDAVFFEGGAPGQVFKFQRWGVSYGTDDKGHLAALVLSLLILILLAVVFTGGFFVDRGWITDAIKLLGPAFTFVAGVAIGKGTAHADRDGR